MNATETTTLRFHGKERPMKAEPDGYLKNGMPVWYYVMPSNDSDYLLTRKAKDPAAKGYGHARDLTPAEYQTMRFDEGSAAEAKRQAVCKRGFTGSTRHAEGYEETAKNVEGFVVPANGTVFAKGRLDGAGWYLTTPHAPKGDWTQAENVWSKMTGPEPTREVGEPFGDWVQRTYEAEVYVVTDAAAAEALKKAFVKDRREMAAKYRAKATKWAKGLKD